MIDLHYESVANLQLLQIVRLFILYDIYFMSDDV